MRKLVAVTSAVILFQTVSMAQAQNISFNINVGGPPIIISQPPEFLYPPELGFGVAIGVPYDMFYFSGVYYIFRGGGWYRTSSYGGNWIKLRSRELPLQLGRYKIAQIHEYRDRESRIYMKDRTHYRGNYFRPGKEGRDEHRGMSGPNHDGQRDMRDQRHDNRGGERKEEGRER